MKNKSFYCFLIAGLVAISCNGTGDKTAKNNADPTPTKVTEQQCNAVISTIMARRSIRKYKTQAVEEAKLHEILKCGINAPTGRYKQSWQIRVVQNPEFLAQIDEGFNAQREKNGKQGETRAFYGAPCLIFIAYDQNYDLSQVDCGLLGQNIILAAQSLDLGTCCLGQVTRFMLSDDAQNLLARLELPETHKLLYAISLGYPDESPNAKPRDTNKIKFVN